VLIVPKKKPRMRGKRYISLRRACRVKISQMESSALAS
jgi:hypothetical protein